MLFLYGHNFFATRVSELVAASYSISSETVIISGDPFLQNIHLVSL